MIAGLVGALLMVQPGTLWQVGVPDGKADGFALAPSGYREYRNDPTYIVGKSPVSAWTYVLPGPADSWGGSRVHRGLIYFGLKGRVTAGRLVCDFVDSQSQSPPRLSLWVNGTRVAGWQAPNGTGEEAINGRPERGRHSTWAAAIPAKALRDGVNGIEIRTDRGSWVLFDSIRFEGSIALTPVSAGLLVEPLEQEQVVLRTTKGPRQRISLRVTNFGKPGILAMTGGVHWSGEMQTGARTIGVEVPAVKQRTKLDLTLTIGGIVRHQAVEIEPVRPWTVYLLPHSHVDIGYTDYQQVVATMHRRNLFDALSVAKESAAFPADSRYRFNMEATWVLDNLLHDGTPAELAQVRDGFRRGIFDCSANYCNTLTGLMRPEEMMRGYGFSNRLRSWVGVDLTTATQTDVPGITWGAVAAMSQAGIKNLVLMPNPSDRIGGVLAEWQDKPFFWVSPSGRERVLVWETASYGVAHGLRHFNGDRTKMFRTADPTQNFIEGYIFDQLKQLASEHYPYDVLAFPWSGTDNFPVDADVPYAARHWNQTYVTPHVVVSTVSQACNALVKRYASKIPVVRGDLTPYWEDGAGSSARETAMNRASADRLVQAEALTAMTNRSEYEPKSFWKAWSDVILYSEHTWGAYNSVSDPDSQFARGQWMVKRGFAVEADRISRRLLEDARGAAASRFTVVNTTSWPRTDLVLLSRAESSNGDRVLDASGRSVPSQRLRSGELALLAKNVPAYGSIRLKVIQGKAYSLGKARASAWKLESPEWQISIDPKTGGISRLWSRKLRRDFAGSHEGHRLNEYLYLPGADLKDPKAPEGSRCEVIDAGPLVARLRITSTAAGAKELTQDLQVTSGLDRVDLSNEIDKIAVRSKEAVHFAFPFHVPNGQVRIQGPWAVIRPDVDQMPGANKNWFTTQYFADVSNGSYGVTWSSLDAPLLEVGGITATLLDGGFNPRQWIHHLGPTQTLYSWALNNHWYTNYKADQEGVLKFRYSLRAHRAYAPDEAYQFGAGLAQPLLASFRTSGPALLTVSNPRVVVTALKPSEDGKALMARLWCVGDKAAAVRLTWRPGMVSRVSFSDSSERPLRPVHGRVAIAGWQVITVRATLAP